MNASVMDLSLWNLIIAYIFVLVILGIFRTRGIHREKMILIATMRMTIQLTLMGYVFLFVFQHPNWLLSIGMLCIMMVFAIHNAIKRISFVLSKELKLLIIVSMILGYLFTALIFLFIVLSIHPWYDPQYLIPISGMIIGNAMTGIALGANRLCANMQDHRERIENALMLGASMRKSCYTEVNEAFDSAILPTMNNMMTMGIVSIPGMMTGQILSGTFPLTAIKYQIGIMLAILGCTAITVVVFVTLGYKTFFDKNSSLC